MKWVAFAALVCGALFPLKSVQAQTLFSQAEVDASRLVAVASPYSGGAAHQLLIIEQQSNARACWSENPTSSRMTLINPLLTQFDFTGVCGRSIDSNGYSIRMGGEDLGWRYALRVVRRNGDLLLVGAPTVNRNQPELQIGRAYGVSDGFVKLQLNPGWRMTRRVYQGQSTGHIYLTNDRALSAIAAAPPTPVVSPVIPPVVSPVRPTKPSVPISVPRPDRPTATRPLPAPPVVSQPIYVPPVTNPAVKPAPTTRPTPVRPINPGDYVVPTIEE